MIETCSVCAEEVRWGWRPGPKSPAPSSGFWMHRDPDVDHVPIFGRITTADDLADIERELDLPRWRVKPCDPPFPLLYTVEPYTTREFDIARMKKAAREAAEIEEEIDPVTIPEPEVLSTPIEVGDPRLPVGAKTIINLGLKNGWSARAFYSRGPRVHASQGTLLDISDYVVLRMRPDEGDRRAVAVWAAGKFSYCWPLVADLEARRYTTSGRGNSDALKAWIRGE